LESLSKILCLKEIEMEDLKKAAFLIALLIIAVVDIAIYWNQHLYYKARDIEDFEKRIDILDKTFKPLCLNDDVFFELGRAYYERGENSFGEEKNSEFSFDQSIRYFNRSIRINPSSHLSHFYLGRALLTKSLVAQSTDYDFFSEYKKAALLVNRYASIYFDVSKIFLSRWSLLSQEEKDFTLMMLKEIFKGGEQEKILSLLSIWEINIRDYEIIRDILPENEFIYYLYAKFLGEKSLDLEERHYHLAKAEFLVFQRARDFYRLGEKELYNFRLKESSSNFRNCLRSLDRIKFYQNFSNQNLIDDTEYKTLRKSALLNLAKSLIGEKKEWRDVEKYLREYLNHELSSSEVNDLERYLVERDILRSTVEESFSNLERLAFHLLLSFKQKRYSDLVRVGQSVRSSYGLIPENALPYYVEILQLVGDSHQKHGSYYMAKDFYQLALDRDPKNIETLLRIRDNLEQLNDMVEINEINTEIESILAKKEIELRNPTIGKGQRFSGSLIFDGLERQMEFHFNENLKERNPLISIVLNNSVVWEDYLVESPLQIALETNPGENRIDVVAVNHQVDLIKLKWEIY
jgi:hypothetical protein